MERKDKMIMLNTTNSVVSKKNISMKYCNAEFINKDGRIVVYCNSGFYGNAVSDFASCLYNFFSDKITSKILTNSLILFFLFFFIKRNLTLMLYSL